MSAEGMSLRDLVAQLEAELARGRGADRHRKHHQGTVLRNSNDIAYLEIHARLTISGPCRATLLG